MDGNRIILDEQDACNLLKVLYNGVMPARVHTLICACGATADLRVSVKAWNGWQILPHAKCPRCIETRPGTNAEVYPYQARERFLMEIETTLEQKVG